MWGCWSELMARASLSNRCRCSTEADESCGRILTATVRSRRVSRARYTSPIPPEPISSMTSYGPSRVPACTIAPHRTARGFYLNFRLELRFLEDRAVRFLAGGGEGRASAKVELRHGSAWGPVILTVFKTVVRQACPVTGEFDSHTLPPQTRSLNSTTSWFRSTSRSARGPRARRSPPPIRGIRSFSYRRSTSPSRPRTPAAYRCMAVRSR